MSDAEIVQEQLHELKNIPADEYHTYFAGSFKKFLFLLPAQKIEVAQSFHQWASEIVEQQPLRFYFSEFLLGLSYHLNDEHENALQYFRSSKNHFESQCFNEGVGICDILVSSIYRTFGNFDLALKTAWEGYALLNPSPHYRTFIIGATNGIANIYLELHNYDEALKMFLTTYEESTKIGDEYFILYALQGLGKVNNLKHRYAVALEFFQKALELAEKYNLPVGIANSLSEMAGYYCHQEDFDAAEDLNRKALAIREQNNLTGGAITSCIHLGEIFIRQSKWDEALEILNKALAMAERIKVKPKIFQVHLLLSQVYESNHDLEKSLHHFKLFHEIQDQVQEEDNARKLADAKVLFEAEQARKENIIIKNQKEEIQKKNIELEDTIYELTLAKISRKAKVYTWIFAIILFVFQDYILQFVLGAMAGSNYFLTLIAKMAIIFSLSPVNSAIEHYLLKRVVKIRKPAHVAIG